MKSILIIGSGNIGEAVYEMAVSLSYDVSLADINKPDWITKNTKFHTLDVSSIPDIVALIDQEKYWGIIACTPYFLNINIAEAATITNTNYFDLTEDVVTTNHIKDLSLRNKAAMMPQCGLAPGAVNVVANYLMEGFDTIDSALLRVGALPQFPNNKMKYNITWSTAGVINEYIEPCNAIVNGNLMDTVALSDLEHLIIDGDEYEAFNTSGGVGTLVDTYRNKVKNINYKSIRYNGHRDYMRFFLDDLGFKDNKKLAVETFDNNVPRTREDVVILWIKVIGQKNGQLIEETYSRKVYPDIINNKHFTAIQITTAAGLMGSVNYVDKNNVSGFITQENVPFNSYIGTKYSKIYM